jgi:hypothetical protein
MLKLKPKDFNALAILLGGPVDYDMYKDFRTQLDRPQKTGWSSPNCRRLAEIGKWPG